MTRARWLALAFWLAAVLPAAAQDIVVRTSVQPSGAVKLGQPVALLVDVLFPGDMPHPPRVTKPRVEGAQVFRFESQGITIRERIGGGAYIGQRFEFDIYPRRAGTLAVPPVRVTLLDTAGDAIGERTGPGQSIEAVVPPGLDPTGPIVAASAVTMQETWQPVGQAFHVGDAVTRILKRSASGVPGLALAAVDFAAPDGVRAYADPPIINDQIERGEVTGQRTDRVTYVFERAGDYVLPAVSQPWWDLRDGSAHTLTAPPRHFIIAAVPAQAPASAASTARTGAWSATCVAAAVILGFLMRSRVTARWAAWRRRRAGSEATAFRALQRASRKVDARITYQAWRRWNAVRPSPSLTPGLAIAVGALERALFGGHSVWGTADAGRLRAAARAARKRPSAVRHEHVLPPLNPDARGDGCKH